MFVLLIVCCERFWEVLGGCEELRGIGSWRKYGILWCSGGFWEVLTDSGDFDGLCRVLRGSCGLSVVLEVVGSSKRL